MDNIVDAVENIVKNKKIIINYNIGRIKNSRENNFKIGRFMFLETLKWVK